MARVFFLVNHLREFDFGEYLEKHLPSVSVTIGDSLPGLKQSDYDLTVLWSYRKIIPEISKLKNVVLFHSTDLPQGKGWAPIYHAIADGLEYFTISGILAADRVDAGDIVVKARFRIRDDHTAEMIRKWDHEISVMLVKKILDKFEGLPIKGQRQSGPSSFHEKRRPADNELKPETSLAEALRHIRACEEKHPAFVRLNKTKYLLYAEPETLPPFPEDLAISFHD